MNMRKPKEFGLKHILGLVIAILISVLILLFSNEIRKLEEFGYIGVFLMMLLMNATLMLPSPGMVFIFLLGGTLPNPVFVGIAAGLGAAIGELIGYLAGYSGSGVVSNSATYHKIEKWVHKYGLWFIFALALVPNPVFDLGGLAAGALGIKWWKFLLVTAVGKILRSIIIAYAGYLLLN